MPTQPRSPSGLAMPTSIEGLALEDGMRAIVLADDMLDPELANWERWGGSPEEPAKTGGGNGVYDESRVTQYGSIMALGCRLDNRYGPDVYSSGGVGTKLTLTSATRIEVRAKLEAPRPGVDYLPAMLWPPSNDWPEGGEGDICEANPEYPTVRARPLGAFTAHYHHAGPNGEDLVEDLACVPDFMGGKLVANFSLADWHTYGSTWIPGESMTVDVDGIRQGTFTEGIVTTPLHLVIELLQQGQPSGFSAILVDWALVYVGS